MSAENKTAVRRLFDEVWNKGNTRILDELFADDYTHTDPATPEMGRGPESERKRVELYRGAFPDLRLTVEDMVAEGDRVVARWTCRATHKGDLAGLPPTNKQITITGVSIARFSGGKIAEGWVNWDALGMFRQLGAIPEPTKARGVGR